MLKLEDIESGCEFEFVSYDHKVKYSKLATYNKSLIRKCISDNGTFTVAGGSSKDSVKVKCCNRVSILSESMEIDLDELQFFKLVTKDAPVESLKRHKNADMIIAKANDTSLVLLFRSDGAKFDKWAVSQSPAPFAGQPLEYYLCHPKHVDACLHWLNEGVVVIDGVEVDGANRTAQVKWHFNSHFMGDKLKITIKPKKEKRWIAYNPKTNKIFVHDHPCDKDVKSAEGFQEIEIEVEV